MRSQVRKLAAAGLLALTQVVALAVPAAASTPTVTSDMSSGHVFNTPRPMFTGHAIDDAVVRSVDVAIRLEDPSLWLQGDGSFAPKFRRHGAEIASRDSSATDWSWTARSELPDGDYRLWVAAYDDDRNRTTLKPQVRFTIATDGLPVPFFKKPRFEIRDTFFGNGVFTSSDVVLEGSALDDGGVTRVRVGIKQANTDLWLQRDGTFAPKIQKFEADLADPGSNATTWSFAVRLPDDRYVLSVRAFDDEGNSDSKNPRPSFRVDTVGPTIEVAVPFGATLFGPDVALNGVLEDVTLVHDARVAIRDRATGLWLQPDGSFGARHRKIDAGGSGFGDETVSSWFIRLTLPEGDYSLSVSARDVFGNVSSLRPWWHFSVDPTIDTLPVPTTNVVAGDVFTTSPLLLSGEAADDIGIARVRIGIKDRDTGLWWYGSGFSDRVERFDAEVEDLGAAMTAWHVEAALPDGRYALSVRAFDVQGYSQSISPWVKFKIDTS